MGNTTKGLLAAGVLTAIGLCLYGLDEDPVPIPTVESEHGDHATSANAANSTNDTTAQERREVKDATLETERPWLDHPYTLALDVRVIDRYGLPVRGHRLELGPVDGPLNKSEHRTDDDGRLQVQWSSRVPSSEIVLSKRGGLLHRVPVQHGHPARLTLLGRRRGAGQMVLGSATLRMTFLDDGSDNILIMSGDDEPEMRLGLHPFAVFGAAAGESRGPSGPHLALRRSRIELENLLSNALTVYDRIEDRAPTEKPAKTRIAGTVFGEDGTPASKVHVALLGSGPQPLADTTTDNDGRFAFDEVKAGEFTIRAGGDDEGLATIPAVTTMGTTLVTLVLARGARIQGRVIDANGNPVAKTRVTFRASDGGHCDETETDEEGAFTFANLPGSPGTVTVRNPAGQHAFPLAFAAGVLCNTNDLELRAAIAGGELWLEPDLPDDLGGQPTIRVWSEELHLATTMPPRSRKADEGAPIWRLKRLAAGWYRVELLHPAFGRIDAGRHWVDGKSVCKLGRILLPDHAKARIDLGGEDESPPATATEAGDSGRESEEPRIVAVRAVRAIADFDLVPSVRAKKSPIELYRLRPDFDVRVEATTPGQEMRLPPGDYAAFWADAAGATHIERFTTEAGKTASIRIER